MITVKAGKLVAEMSADDFLDLVERAQARGVAVGDKQVNRGRSGAGARSPSSNEVPPNGSAVAQKAVDDLKFTLGFLRAIKAGGEAGTESNELIGAVGIQGTRGLGPATIKIKRVLGDRGFELDEVATSTRDDPNGPRRWRGQVKLDACLVALQKALSALKGGD